MEKIALSYLTHMMSMIDLVAIGVEILKIDSVCLWIKGSVNLSL